MTMRRSPRKPATACLNEAVAFGPRWRLRASTVPIKCNTSSTSTRLFLVAARRVSDAYSALRSAAA
jgi:hypothetical protein